MNAKIPSDFLLVGSITRCDGGELRVYRKLYKGRPYIEISNWGPPGEGAHCIHSLNLRRGELRPVLLALLEACKELGLSPISEQASKSWLLFEEKT